jgi:hypothetical protein
MNKTKIALTILTIVISIGPLLGVVFIYRDNFMGIVFPPQIQDVINGNNNGNSGSPFGATASDFQMPTISNQPQYDPQTGNFQLAVNFTNPLNSTISVDQFSAQIKDADNNALLGNISLANPINISPGENSIIDIAGNLSQDTINQIQAQYGQNPNIALENINVVIAGITLHLDELNIGQIQLPG